MGQSASRSAASDPRRKQQSMYARQSAMRNAARNRKDNAMVNGVKRVRCAQIESIARSPRRTPKSIKLARACHEINRQERELVTALSMPNSRRMRRAFGF